VKGEKSMLEIKNFTKKYGDFKALEDINLKFDKGVYALLAPNGAGKTTLIKSITTLIFPTSGEILYNRKNILELDEKYRDILGYLPQKFGYYKDSTPKEYLMYLSALKGIDKNNAKKRIDELLEKVAMSEFKNKKMKGFSGGMLQRIGIAQALLNDPEVLILDEPTAGLDPKERARLRNLIATLAKDKIIILSTHIVSDIESIASQVVFIKDKKVLMEGSISNICSNLKGKVYETTVEYEEVEKFRGQYKFLSEKEESRKIRIRFLSDNEKKFDSMEPNLEDVFLSIYGEDVI
jgi:ABC-2 type transport system ATP-binding protein